MTIADTLTKPFKRTAPDQFEAMVSEAQIAVVAAQSAYRTAAARSIAEPSPANDKAAQSTRQARDAAQAHLEACEIALADSQTAEGKRRQAEETKRIQAEDRATIAIFADHEASVVRMAAATKAFAEAYADLRDHEHRVQGEFANNDRLREREDLAAHAVGLQRAVAVEMSRTTPDPRGEISNVLASLPPGALAMGDDFETTLPRTKWKTLADKFADRARVALSLLTVKAR